MKSRHITVEYPAKQIQFEPLPLIYCRSILLFSFFFPSELEINNSAGNRSFLVANSLTSHPISFSLSFSLSCPLLYLICPLSFPLLHLFPPVCACSVCMCISTLKSFCMLVWVVIHLFLAHIPTLPSFFPSLIFFPSFILSSPLLSSFLRSRAWWQSHDLYR